MRIACAKCGTMHYRKKSSLKDHGGVKKPTCSRACAMALLNQKKRA